ncbi:MAG: TrmH family RNA methyltransferase [Muribaculaceae bacterium]|nr:TrmH family RNA methyltransferase [Muribaculaceae bacterium]
MDRTKKNILELTRMEAHTWLKADKLPLRLLLDDVRSLNNVGSLLRTSDAFMVDEVVMCGITGTPPHPEIHKTALGAEDSVRWRHTDSCLEEVKRLQAEGWKVCVLEQTHNSVLLNDFKPVKAEKYAVVCGNEVHGVNQAVVDAADIVIEIPQCGAKHSLNVSVSTGILLWTLFSSLS